jgi:hypothetical protein
MNRLTPPSLAAPAMNCRPAVAGVCLHRRQGGVPAQAAAQHLRRHRRGAMLADPLTAAHGPGAVPGSMPSGPP